MAKMLEQSEVFLKKGKENIGRVVLQFPTGYYFSWKESNIFGKDNGSETVIYNIVVFLYEEEKVLNCAFVTQ